MTTRTVCKVDPQGRVFIPGFVRELCSIRPGDAVTIEVDKDNSIRIFPEIDRCYVCGELKTKEKLQTVTIGHRDQRICTGCVRKIVTAANK